MALRVGIVPNDSKVPDACKDLWGAVILQAFEDASYKGVKSECVIFRNQARAWLTNISSDLHFVCDCAGVEVRPLIMKARTMAMEGWPPLVIPGGMKYERSFLDRRW